MIFALNFLHLFTPISGLTPHVADNDDFDCNQNQENSTDPSHIGGQASNVHQTTDNSEFSLLFTLITATYFALIYTINFQVIEILSNLMRKKVWTASLQELQRNCKAKTQMILGEDQEQYLEKERP